jgi:hypothetical protein
MRMSGVEDRCVDGRSVDGGLVDGRLVDGRLVDMENLPVGGVRERLARHAGGRDMGESRK